MFIMTKTFVLNQTVCPIPNISFATSTEKFKYQISKYPNIHDDYPNMKQRNTSPERH
jgi:hypothetical protein